MYKALRTYTSIALLLFSIPAFAEEVARVTLENGATVKLNDDFTWEYVILESQTKPDTAVPVTLPATIATVAALESQASAVTQAPTTAVPVTLPATVGAVAVVESATPAVTEAPTTAVPTTLPAKAETLTSAAIAQAALLKSTAKGGVKVSLLNSQWDDDGRLGLTFELNSNSPEHYVLIELEISLFADSGALIKKETVNVWQAIFRMPDTYLRKGQTRDSRVFWIEDLDPKLWTKELVSLKMGEMDSRM
ncbi:MULTISPECIES: DUF3157 family protein [unclassified Shewanella]|uniref:DUF3157 family protein n=1 Tax=unclassified Shewanella TaxID=196818 RepID=UPI001BC46984|nr:MULTISPECIES: DUF3157 family protein [unclassified Shewanella]GIU14201.1 hypothetical protein TUM4444_23620 [Shewanella sp. MBTL60-112-B1]GIU29806.1 hypothetical protein TUM4445_12460 [Shewanella sp. MBTL60-112-B2]